MERLYEAKQCAAEARIVQDAAKVARWDNNVATAAEVLRKENEEAQQAARSEFAKAAAAAKQQYLQIPLDLVVKYSGEAEPEVVAELRRRYKLVC
eukprot:SAG11_NODE_9107_length_942_cov_2.185053_1_plen_95_part_00